MESAAAAQRMTNNYSLTPAKPDENMQASANRIAELLQSVRNAAKPDVKQEMNVDNNATKSLFEVLANQQNIS